MQTAVRQKRRYSLFTNRQLFWLIAPIVIENIFSTSLGMFDGIMVSSIDAFGHANTAVGNVDSINNLVIQLFSAFATGGTIITSQFLGARNIESAKKSAKHMLVIVLGFSLVIAGLCLALNPYLLQLFYPDVEPDVMELQRTYFYITAASFPLIGIFNGSAALLRAQRKSLVTMTSAGISCVVNVALNALFIYGLKWAVLGAASATLISRVIPAVFMFVMLARKSNIVRVTPAAIFRFRFDGKMVKKILFIAIPSGIESCLFQLGKLLTNTFVNASCYVDYNIIPGKGVNLQANGNSIANNINNIASVVGSGVGTAALTVVGQAVGAGDMDQVKYYMKKMFIISYIANAAMVLLIMFSAHWLVRLYDYPDEAYDIALKCLYLCLSFQLVTYPLSFTTPAILKATSDVKYVMYSAISSMIILRVGICFLLTDDALLGVYNRLFGLELTQGLGAWGFWIAMCADWVGRSVLFVTRLLTGRWKKASGLIAEEPRDRMSDAAFRQSVRAGKKIEYSPYSRRHAKKYNKNKILSGAHRV